MGLGEKDLERTDGFVERCEHPPQRIAGVASGGRAGRAARHWHRASLLMVNLGEGEKVWRTSDAGPKVGVM